MKKIREQNKQIPCLGKKASQDISSSSQFSLESQCYLIKIPASSFVDINTLILKFIWAGENQHGIKNKV